MTKINIQQYDPRKCWTNIDGQSSRTRPYAHQIHQKPIQDEKFKRPEFIVKKKKLSTPKSSSTLKGKICTATPLSSSDINKKSSAKTTKKVKFDTTRTYKFDPRSNVKLDVSKALTSDGTKPKTTRTKKAKAPEGPIVRTWNNPAWRDFTPKENDAPMLSDYQKFVVLEHLKHHFKSGKTDGSANSQYLYRLKRKLEYMYTYKADYPLRDTAGMGILSCRPFTLKRIHCPFTCRILPPVIYQSCDIPAPYLRMKDEIINRAINKYPDLLSEKNKIRYPVNFVYINATHIPAITALINQYFWTGVDISTALEYPEFSCVVCYRRVVVGFGFMAPGTHFNEAYINFLFVRPQWRNAGIGEFILYHLIQTCRRWDITLHVSPSNPAMFLYQKFGFKALKFLRNFYTPYHFINSSESRHAFFMKLERA